MASSSSTPAALRELGDRRRASELGRELVEDSGEAQAQLLEPAGHVHRPRLVTEVPPDLAHDRRDGIAGEVDPAIDVEAVDRLDEADRPDLDEVLQRLSAPRVPRGQGAHERHQLDESAVACSQVALSVEGYEQGVDVRVHGERHRLRGSGTRRAYVRMTIGPSTSSFAAPRPASRRRRTPGSAT